MFVLGVCKTCAREEVLGLVLIMYIAGITGGRVPAILPRKLVCLPSFVCRRSALGEVRRVCVLITVGERLFFVGLKLAHQSCLTRFPVCEKKRRMLPRVLAVCKCMRVFFF